MAAFDRVNVDVAVLRGSRFPTSARVSITQGGRPVLEALVWGVDPGGAALEHDIAPAPEVPPPSEVPSWEERMADVDPADRPPFRFWNNIEHRPLQWRDDWPPPEPASPEGRWWFRFRPTPLFDDPWVDACRLLIPVDTMGWPAAFPAHAHVDPPEVIAPTVDLSAHFHRPATGEEWLLCDAVSPVAAGGLVVTAGFNVARAAEVVAYRGDATHMAGSTELWVDTETPISLYEKLAADQAMSFLLESAEGGETFGRYSFIGLDPILSIRARDGRVVVTGEVPDEELIVEIGRSAGTVSAGTPGSAALSAPDPQTVRLLRIGDCEELAAFDADPGTAHATGVILPNPAIMKHAIEAVLLDVDGTLIGSIRSDRLRPGACELLDALDELMAAQETLTRRLLGTGDDEYPSEVDAAASQAAEPAGWFAYAPARYATRRVITGH